jgi:ankyrin repeat domain-containing protein 50
VSVLCLTSEKCLPCYRFLHASLQMVALQECSSVYDVNETLEQFPTDIKGVYFQTWKRIVDKPSKNDLLAQRCITWVLYATRSLRVEELRHAVASDPVTHSFEESRLVDKESLVAPCRGLLIIDAETDLVRLVREFTLNVSDAK